MTLIQRIWDKLSPDGRFIIDECVREMAEIEQVTYDTYATILSDVEHDFSSNKLPEYCAGNVLCGDNEPNGPTSFRCTFCDEDIPLNDHRSLELVMIHHFVTKHHDYLRTYLNDDDYLIITSAISKMEEDDTINDDKFLEKISFVWELLSSDWQDAITTYMNENISLARTTRDVLSIESMIENDGEITLSHNEITDIQMICIPQCNIHGEITIFNKDLARSIIAHVILEDIGTMITMNPELPQEYITAAHNELTTFLETIK